MVDTVSADSVKESNVFPVNSNGEILLQSGTGDNVVAGYIPSGSVPKHTTTDKMVVKLPDETATFSVDGTSLTGSGRSIPVARHKPASLSGSFTGNGTSTAVVCGFRPQIVFLRSETPGVSAIWKVQDVTWWDSTERVDQSNSEQGTITFTDTGFTVNSAASANGSGVINHWFAFHDGGTDSVRWADHAGNGIAGRVLRMHEGFDAEAVLFTRDNTNFALIANKGYPSFTIDGSPVDVVLNDSGLVTVSAEGPINEWTTLGMGESCPSLAFGANASETCAFVYTGTGATRELILPFEPECFIIFNKGATGAGRSRMWTADLAANQSLAFASTATAQPQTGEITSVIGNKITLSSSLNVNLNGGLYSILAFKRTRQIPELPAPRQLKTKKVLNLKATSGYVNCGTSDTLKFSGAFSMEFFGSHGYTDLVRQVGGAGVNDELKQQTIMWRSNGADATDGAVSFGMLVGSQVAYASSGNWPNVGLFVSCFDKWDMSNGTEKDLNKLPWNTGISVPPNKDVHLIVTHDGAGFWNIFMNGKIVKERNLDMAVAYPGRLNSVGYTGHSMSFGARKRGTASFDHKQGGLQVRSSRLYNRALTATEAMQNYNSHFVGYPSSTTNGLTEEWVANAVSGSTMTATISSANNGAITNGSVMG